MPPDYSRVQGCRRKPPPLPNFFQVSSKLLRLLKPLTNSDKNHQPQVFTLFQQEWEVAQTEGQVTSFWLSLWTSKPVVISRGRMPMEIPCTNTPNPMPKPIILPSCWFTVLLISWHLCNSCGQATLKAAKHQCQGGSWACDHHDCHKVLSYNVVASLSRRSSSQGIFKNFYLFF